MSFLFQTKSKKFLVRDRDTKFLGKFDEILKSLNTDVIRIPYRFPNLNPYAEGWIGTIKRECLDHFVVFGKRHFKHLIHEFVKYYNTVRPHSGKENLPLDKVSFRRLGKFAVNHASAVYFGTITGLTNEDDEKPGFFDQFGSDSE